MASVGSVTSLPERRRSAVPFLPRRHGGNRGVPGLVIGVGLAACALAALGWMGLGPDIDEPAAAAGRYLERIEAGDDTAAYRMVCARTHRDLTAKAFTARVVAGPRPVSHAVTGGEFLDDPGHVAGLDVRIVDRTGATRQISLTVENGEGAWKVCGETLV